MSESFFENVDLCSSCGKDHILDYDQALQIHAQSAHDTARDKVLAKNKIPLRSYTYAYLFAGLFAIIILYWILK